MNFKILFLPCFGLWRSQLWLITFTKSENPIFCFFLLFIFLNTITPPADVDSKTAMQTLWLRWEWHWYLIKALWWISIISGGPGIIRLIISETGSRSVSGAAKHQQPCLFYRLNSHDEPLMYHVFSFPAEQDNIRPTVAIFSGLIKTLPRGLSASRYRLPPLITESWGGCIDSINSN